ncbi:hypothetical protein JKP88DRAFT_330860 [Tribonema minus]|uniref:START domain-containing protein n=1 Tax=Tribonema minus TaxID=303371 RepID=A0A835YQ35_9STRA|nr:hypothetical protein JKP88DRAFT_330860 [Tribonema minus]
MARGTLAAHAEDLFALFQSNDRVHEYNDNCADVRDLEVVSQHSKITWARSPRFGPFKARDFVTVVSYTTLADGTLAVVNRPVNHAAAPATKDYVRAEILIATNMMRANAHDPRKTDFVTVAHVNPGGVADSTLGANVVNMLCAQAPLKLLQALERAANS